MLGFLFFVFVLFVETAIAYSPGVVDSPYAEIGVDPQRAGMTFGPEEQVDLFSGAVNLLYRDHCIRGAYGLDMCITRTYSSKIVDEQLLPVNDDTWAGTGWNIIPGGRFRFDANLDASLGGSYYLWVQLPGRPVERAPLVDASDVHYRADTDSNAFPNQDSTSTIYVTKSGLFAYTANSGSEMYVIDRAGVEHFFDVSGGTHADGWYYGEELANPNGDVISITYDGSCTSHANGSGAIDTMTDAYQRSFTFSVDSACYVDGVSWTDSNGTPVSISYTVDSSGDLASVAQPTGETTTYAYAGPNGELDEIDLPTGGQITYDYAAVSFLWDYDPFTPTDITYTTYVLTGRVHDDGTSTYTWTYDFDDYAVSSYSSSDQYRHTAVTLPDGTYVEHHYHSACYAALGAGSYSTCYSTLVGLPVGTTTYTSSGGSLLQDTYTNYYDSAGNINGIETSINYGDPFHFLSSVLGSPSPSMMVLPQFTVQNTGVAISWSSGTMGSGFITNARHYTYYGDAALGHIDDYGNAIYPYEEFGHPIYGVVSRLQGPHHELEYAWSDNSTLEGHNLVTLVSSDTAGLSSSGTYGADYAHSVTSTSYSSSSGSVGWISRVDRATYPSTNSSDDEYVAYTWTNDGSGDLVVEIDHGNLHSEKRSFEYGTLTDVSWYDPSTAAWTSFSSQVADSYTGLVTSRCDGNGNCISLTYDAKDRPTQVAPPLTDATNVTYDLTASTPTIEESRGGGVSVTTYSFDGLGRHVQSQFPNGNPVKATLYGYEEFERDYQGREERRYSLHDGTSTGYMDTGRDGLGRITSADLIEPSAGTTCSSSTSYAYSSTYGSVYSSHTDSNKISSTTYFDALGRPAWTVPAAGGMSVELLFGSYTHQRWHDLYDSTGASVLVGQIHSLDDQERVWNLNDDQAGSRQWDTNAAGEVDCEYDASGDYTYQEYDFAGRPSSTWFTTACADPGTPADLVRFYDGDTVPGHPRAASYTHDNPVGRLTGTRDAAGLTLLSYDEESRGGNLVRVFTGLFGGEVEQDYVYDNEGQLDSLTVTLGPDSFEIDRDHGPGGRVQLIDLTVTAGGSTSSYAILDSASWLPSGAYEELAFGNGVTQTLTPDELNRPTNISTSGASTDVDLTYAYDGNNNVTSLTDSGGTDSFGYAANYLLETVSYGDTSTEITYVYDEAGNMKERAGDEALALGIDFTGRSFTANQETATGSWIYDSVGNVTDTPTLSLDYTPLGQVSDLDDGTDTVEYQYDVDGRLVREILTPGSGAPPTARLYSYDSAGRILIIQDKTATGLPLLRALYVYLGDMPVAVVSRQAGAYRVFWMHQDMLGSTRSFTGEAAVTVRQQEFTPFGALRSESGLPALADVGFYAGHLQPGDWNTVVMGQRSLVGELPGFSTPDRGFPGEVLHPLSINRFSYVGQNPMSYRDPSGDYGFLAVAGIAWAGVELSLSAADGWAFGSTLNDWAHGTAEWSDVAKDGALLVGGIAMVGGGGAVVRKVYRGASKAGSVFLDGGKPFKSHWALEKFMRATKPSAEHSLHHIVEQGTANVARFGEDMVHNSKNAMWLPNKIHFGKGISGWFASGKGWLPEGYSTARQWAQTLTFDQQYRLGLWVIVKKGGGQYLTTWQRQLARTGHYSNFL